MFKGSRSARAGRTTEVEAVRARGGVSFGSILTGVVVAFGAFVVLSAIISAILTAVGASEGSISAAEISGAGIAVAVGLVIAQFLSYLWGGYTAGRMARGKGLLNGILVPVLAIVIALVLGGIAAYVANEAGVSVSELPEPSQSLPLSDLADIGTVTGIALLAAMLLGGALGGGLGERWHTKLERRTEAEAPERVAADRSYERSDERGYEDESTTSERPSAGDRTDDVGARRTGGGSTTR